jgi:hypothetical protein
VPLFESTTEQAVVESLRRARGQARKRMTADYNKAIDFLDERAVQHVRAALELRYPSHQAQQPGERIQPVHIPLTERFVHESASAYNRPVTRTLHDAESLDPDDDATAALARVPGVDNLNAALHRCDQISTLLKSCAPWIQVRRGRVVLRPIVPQNTHPVATGETYADAADPDDYQGYVVELGVSEDVSYVQKMRYVFVGAEAHAYYTASEPYEPEGKIKIVDNPMVWPQVVDDTLDGIPTGRAQVQELPLQMITWMHHGRHGELIPDTDVSIVDLNLEIDVTISAMLHDLRMHGGAQMFMQLGNPDEVPGRLAFGSNFVLPLGPDETVGYAGSPVNYESIVRAVNDIVRMFANAKRQSPNDYSIADVGPESGFAKAVASLPKLEARNERIEQLEMFEGELLWPRLGASIDFLGGHLPRPASSYVMRTQFSEIEFPRTTQEITTEGEFRLKHGLDSPASMLAQERGISEEEAQEIVDKNKATQPKENSGGRFGFAAARRDRKQPPSGEGGEADLEGG